MSNKFEQPPNEVPLAVASEVVPEMASEDARESVKNFLDRFGKVDIGNMIRDLDKEDMKPEEREEIRKKLEENLWTRDIVQKIISNLESKLNFIKLIKSVRSTDSPDSLKEYIIKDLEKRMDSVDKQLGEIIGEVAERHSKNEDFNDIARILIEDTRGNERDIITGLRKLIN